MNFLARIWAKIEAEFSDDFVPVAESFFGALFHSIAANGGQLLINAATTAVDDAERNGGTGEEKLANAKATVVNSLEANGVTVVMNAVNAAIEAAVAQMKANSAVDAKVAAEPVTTG